MLRQIQTNLCLLPLLLVTLTGAASAQDTCSNSNPHTEATPLPTALPDPKDWSAGTPLGIVLDDKGKPAKNEDGTPIVDGRMTAPQNQTGPSAKWKHVYVAPGARVPVAVESVTDMDHYTQEDHDPCATNPQGDEGDSMTYHWTADQGTFDDANSSVTTWTAPLTVGQYGIGCAMNDTPTAITAPEAGSRDDNGISVGCVVEVTNLIVTADSDSICAGGVNSAVHQTVVTAHIKDNAGQPRAGATVTFSLNNSDEDYPATLSATSAVSDAQGEAKVTLTSSTLIGATASVHGSCDGMNGESGDIRMDAPGEPTWKIDPDELIADGESTADVQATLKFSDKAVNGHSINWHILRISDTKGKLLYDLDSTTLTTMPSGYGSITGAGEAPLGTYHGTYTVGTKAGTIVFEITDETTYEDGPDEEEEPTTPAPSAFAPQLARGAPIGPQPKTPAPKLHPKKNNSQRTNPMKFVVKVYWNDIKTSFTDEETSFSRGHLIEDKENSSYQVIIKVKVNCPKKKSAPNQNAPAPKINPLTLSLIRKPSSGGTESKELEASLVGYDNTSSDWLFDTPRDSEDGKSTIWTYVRKWDISGEVGKWTISVKDQQNSVPATFKIDKRTQVADLASYWTTLSTDENWQESLYCPNGRTLFGQCGGFTNFIYEQLGLLKLGSIDTDSAKIIPDSGIGALIFFYNRANLVDRTTADHVGIKIDNYNRVDNNCPPGTHRPTTRGLFDGVGIFSTYKLNPPMGAPPSASGSTISILDTD